MNRLKTIVLFAGIFGIGLGAVSLTDSSATSLSIFAATPQTQNSMGMLGHVEYTLFDKAGSIKQYLQGDNLVVEDGKDCVARMVFDNSTTDPGVCPKGNNEFQYIAIGNDTSAADPIVDETLSALTTDGGCASSSDGEMARKLVPVVITAATGGTGAIVVLDTVASPFDFGVSNATGNIMQSGIFNTDNPKDATTGECSSLAASSSMFAIQNLNALVGITVSDGDSLSVKWTITVG